MGRSVQDFAGVDQRDLVLHLDRNFERYVTAPSLLGGLDVDGRANASFVQKVYRVAQVTQMGVEALKSGLEAVNRRKKLMDELASFYEEKFEGGKSRAGTTDEEKTE